MMLYCHQLRHILLILGILFQSVVAQQFLSKQYFSESQMTSSNEVRWFKASICSPEMYNGMLVILKIAPIYAPWDAIGGNIAMLAIYNSTLPGTPALCTNGAVTDPHMFCTFVYDVQHGSLFIRTQSGKASNIIYTLHMSFQKTINIKPPNPVSYPQITEPINQVVEPLRQWARLDVPGHVPNKAPPEGIIEFWMEFCPSRPIYNISFALQATDASSAFISYICTQTPCRAGNAFIQDGCACPFNQILISGNMSVYYSTLYVSIQGWGEYAMDSWFWMSVVLNE